MVYRQWFLGKIYSATQGKLKAIIGILAPPEFDEFVTIAVDTL